VSLSLACGVRADLRTVLTTDEAVDLAIEYGVNPIIDDELAFDILPE
jgi:hypothetical protein